MSKQYSVTSLVKNTKADKAAAQAILEAAQAKGSLMTIKHAREQLAARRFRERIAAAGKVVAS